MNESAIERLKDLITVHGTEDDFDTLAALLEDLHRLHVRTHWLEMIREGAARALCARDGIQPDEVISDAGHVAWEFHVYDVARKVMSNG